MEQDIGLPDVDISYGLHLYSRNYVSTLLAAFPKYVFKFMRMYPIMFRDAFACTFNSLIYEIHIRISLINMNFACNVRLNAFDISHYIIVYTYCVRIFILNASLFIYKRNR